MQNNNYIDAGEKLEVFNCKNEAKIDVYVEPSYLESQSQFGNYAFSYKVYMENVGDTMVQVIARHWIVTDANEQIHEIKGLGVVGEQPILQIGQKYEYSSTTVLPTTTGTMKGTYLCITEGGDLFTADIPEFVLALPRVLH
jgi:ApaG protein